MSKPDPFFVDARVGCVAVRDRRLVDPDNYCLDSDTAGVRGYWHGERTEVACPTCGHRRFSGWQVSEASLKAAKQLCDNLNGIFCVTEKGKP